MRVARVLRCAAVALIFMAASAAAVTTQTVTTDDGVGLATDVYLPAGAGPFPVVLERTPYGKANFAGDATRWTGYGYAYVVQDIRGTGASGGAGAQRFANDGWGPQSDSRDAIEWICAQTWCDGHVATVGFSAMAAASMLATGASDLLAAQIIHSGPGSFYGHWTYQGGVLRQELTGPEWDTAGQWKANPAYNNFWAQHDSIAYAPNVETPGLHMTGWFDLFQAGPIEGFMARQHNGGIGARGTQHLLIDPRDHAGLTGELTFPAAQPSPGHTATRRAFMDRYVKGAGSGVGYTVKYYLMGESGKTDGLGNVWRTADDWPPYPITPRAYYLQTDASLATARPGAAASLSYVFDPNDPVPTLGGCNLVVSPGPRDQRPLDPRGDILKFATPALTAPVEIAGPVRVKLYVSSTAVDTDFTAKLIDIYPDGREILFCDGVQRVKFRDSLATPAYLPPGTVGELTIDLWHTALVFEPGHRIGLHVSSSNSPRFEVNPNNGEDHPGGAPSVVATNTVHLQGLTPSALLLPVDSDSDADGDGLPEAGEAGHGTDPLAADSDGDTMLDGWEVANAFDPLAADGDDDGDGDGLTARQEAQRGGNPNSVDTDGDGYWEGIEAAAGSALDAPGSVPPPATGGDLDRDGAANAADVQLVINGVLGRPTPCPADYDRNGRTDALDVQLVINAVLGRT